MFKKLGLLSLMAMSSIQASCVVNPEDVIILKDEYIVFEIQMTQEFEKTLNLLSPETREKFEQLLTDYKDYILNLPDFKYLYKKNTKFFDKYKKFTGKPLTLTLNLCFNEKLNSLPYFQGFFTNFPYPRPNFHKFRCAEDDMAKLIERISNNEEFNIRAEKLYAEASEELSKLNIENKALAHFNML